MESKQRKTITLSRSDLSRPAQRWADRVLPIYRVTSIDMSGRQSVGFSMIRYREDSIMDGRMVIGCERVYVRR